MALTYPLKMELYEVLLSQSNSLSCEQRKLQSCHPRLLGGKEACSLDGQNRKEEFCWLLIVFFHLLALAQIEM